MDTIVCLIKGTVRKTYADSYINKDGKEIKTQKALLVVEINDEPFKMNVEIPKASNWNIGDDVEAYYSIFATKTGYMIVKPIQ